MSRLSAISVLILFVPTVFTPNDDEHNEYFVIQGLNIENFNIQIFAGVIQIGARYNCEVTINSVKMASNTGNSNGNKTFRALVFRIPAN